MSFLALNNQNHQPTLILMIWNFSLLWGSKIAFEFASRRWCAIDLEGSLRYGLSHHLITVKNDKRNHYKKWLVEKSIVCNLWFAGNSFTDGFTKRKDTPKKKWEDARRNFIFREVHPTIYEKEYMSWYLSRIRHIITPYSA